MSLKFLTKKFTKPINIQTKDFKFNKVVRCVNNDLTSRISFHTGLAYVLMPFSLGLG